MEGQARSRRQATAASAGSGGPALRGDRVAAREQPARERDQRGAIGLPLRELPAH